MATTSTHKALQLVLPSVLFNVLNYTSYQIQNPNIYINNYFQPSYILIITKSVIIIMIEINILFIRSLTE